MKIETQLRQFLRGKLDRSTQPGPNVQETDELSAKTKGQRQSSQERAKSESRQQYTASIEQYIPRTDFIKYEKNLEFRGLALTLAEIRAQRALGLYGQQLKFQRDEELRTTLGGLEEYI